MNLLGNLDIILLLILRKERYGYEISKSLKNISNDNLIVLDGTLYPALKRLENQKLLSSCWDNNDNRIKRKYYKITDSGEKRLEELLEDLNKINNIIELLLKEDYTCIK